MIRETSQFSISQRGKLFPALVDLVMTCRMEQKPTKEFLHEANEIRVRYVDRKPIIVVAHPDGTQLHQVPKRDYNRIWDWFNAQTHNAA